MGYTYFGKKVVLQEPANVCYRLYNDDGSVWGNTWGGLEHIRMGEKYYALHKGWGSSFELITPSGECLGGWHDLFVKEMEVKPEKYPSLLSRAMTLFHLKAKMEPQTVQVMFATLGSGTEPVPQDLLDRALWSLDPTDFPTISSLGGGWGGRGGTGSVRAYNPTRRHMGLGKRP